MEPVPGTDAALSELAESVINQEAEAEAALSHETSPLARSPPRVDTYCQEIMDVLVDREGKAVTRTAPGDAANK